MTNKNIILFAPITPPVDKNFVRTLLTLSSLEHLKAKKVILVIPWMGYSLQNKIFLEGESLSAEVIARSLTSPILDQVFLLDIHKAKICKMFQHSCTNIDFSSFFVQEIADLTRNENPKQIVIVGPDDGAQKITTFLGSKFKLDTLIYDKYRDRLSGEISHKSQSSISQKKMAIIVDDGILSGSTIAAAAQQLRKDTITKIIVIATHGLLLEGSIQKLEKNVNQIVISNTVPKSVGELPVLVKKRDCSPIIIPYLKRSF